MAVPSAERGTTRRLAAASSREKDAALLAIADALVARTAEVLAANAEDVAGATTRGTSRRAAERDWARHRAR